MAKVSKYGVSIHEVFRESFNSKAVVIANNGTVSGSPSFSNGEADFTSADGDKISYPITNNVKSILFRITPDTTTESIMDFDGGTSTITVSGGTVTVGAGISSPTVYVNGEAGTTITTAQSTVLVTTATAFNTNDFTVGDGLDGKLDLLTLWDVKLNAEDAKALYVGNFNTDRTDSMSLWWKFRQDRSDVAKEVIYDQSSANNNGTINAAPLDFEPGRYGVADRSVLFADSFTDAIAVDNALALADMVTICGWVKQKTMAGTRAVAGKFSSGFWDSYGRGLKLGGGTLEAMGESNNSHVALTHPLVDTNNWHFIAGVFSTTGLLYLDGNVVATGDISSGREAYTFQVSTTEAKRFIGYMDEIRIFSRALSVAELRNIYDRTTGFQ